MSSVNDWYKENKKSIPTNSAVTAADPLLDYKPANKVTYLQTLESAIEAAEKIKQISKEVSADKEYIDDALEQIEDVGTVAKSAAESARSAQSIANAANTTIASVQESIDSIESTVDATGDLVNEMQTIATGIDVRLNSLEDTVDGYIDDIEEAGDDALESIAADKNAAETAKELAQAYADAASISATRSANSATTAANAASSAEDSNSSAGTYASTAQTAATAAQTSADSASSSATSASSASNAAQTSASTAQTAATAAQGYSSSAEGYSVSARTAATEAGEAAEDAEDSADAASASASDASDSADDAAASASAASTSAQSAAQSAAAAAQSAQSAAAGVLVDGETIGFNDDDELTLLAGTGTDLSDVTFQSPIHFAEVVGAKTYTGTTEDASYYDYEYGTIISYTTGVALDGTTQYRLNEMGFSYTVYYTFSGSYVSDSSFESFWSMVLNNLDISDEDTENFADALVTYSADTSMPVNMIFEYMLGTSVLSAIRPSSDMVTDSYIEFPSTITKSILAPWLDDTAANVKNTILYIREFENHMNDNIDYMSSLSAYRKSLGIYEIAVEAGDVVRVYGSVPYPIAFDYVQEDSIWTPVPVYGYFDGTCTIFTVPASTDGLFDIVTNYEESSLAVAVNSTLVESTGETQQIVSLKVGDNLYVNSAGELDAADIEYGTWLETNQVGEVNVLQHKTRLTAGTEKQFILTSGSNSTYYKYQSYVIEASAVADPMYQLGHMSYDAVPTQYSAIFQMNMSSPGAITHLASVIRSIYNNLAAGTAMSTTTHVAHTFWDSTAQQMSYYDITNMYYGISMSALVYLFLPAGSTAAATLPEYGKQLCSVYGSMDMAGNCKYVTTGTDTVMAAFYIRRIGSTTTVRAVPIPIHRARYFLQTCPQKNTIDMTMRETFFSDLQDDYDDYWCMGYTGDPTSFDDGSITTSVVSGNSALALIPAKDDEYRGVFGCPISDVLSEQRGTTMQGGMVSTMIGIDDWYSMRNFQVGVSNNRHDDTSQTEPNIPWNNTYGELHTNNCTPDYSVRYMVHSDTGVAYTSGAYNAAYTPNTTLGTPTGTRSGLDLAGTSTVADISGYDTDNLRICAHPKFTSKASTPYQWASSGDTAQSARGSYTSAGFADTRTEGKVADKGVQTYNSSYNNDRRINVHMNPFVKLFGMIQNLVPALAKMGMGFEHHGTQLILHSGHTITLGGFRDNNLVQFNQNCVGLSMLTCGYSKYTTDFTTSLSISATTCPAYWTHGSSPIWRIGQHRTQGATLSDLAPLKMCIPTWNSSSSTGASFLMDSHTYDFTCTFEYGSQASPYTTRLFRQYAVCDGDTYSEYIVYNASDVATWTINYENPAEAMADLHDNDISTSVTSDKVLEELNGIVVYPWDTPCYSYTGSLTASVASYRVRVRYITHFADGMVTMMGRWQTVSSNWQSQLSYTPNQQIIPNATNPTAARLMPPACVYLAFPNEVQRARITITCNMLGMFTYTVETYINYSKEYYLNNVSGNTDYYFKYRNISSSSKTLSSGGILNLMNIGFDAAEVSSVRNADDLSECKGALELSVVSAISDITLDNDGAALAELIGGYHEDVFYYKESLDRYLSSRQPIYFNAVRHTYNANGNSLLANSAATGTPVPRASTYFAQAKEHLLTVTKQV